MNNKNIYTEENEERKKKWITFNYHSTKIRKITKLIQNTNLQVAFKPPNTIFKTL